MDEGNEITALEAPQKYREPRPNVFPSKGSLDWFIRCHREELIKARALLLIAGKWHVSPRRFDAVVLEIGQRAAQREQVPT